MTDISTIETITTDESTNKRIRLAGSSLNFLGYNVNDSPWSPDDVDKMETKDFRKEYQKIVKKCRFFYRKDTIVSTVVNKLVEIGITDLVIEKGKLSANELRIFESVKPDIQRFIEDCALEYLISGLVVPEIKYASVPSSYLKSNGIKKYGTLQLPIAMWLRDPSGIKINSSMIMNKPSFYVIIPEELYYFITNKGIYPDGTKDPQLYAELLKYYPDFVAMVRSGVKEILLENDLITRRKVMSDSPYPTPYLHAALEALEHKRNLRKMDYSIAARVISAIQLFRLGDKDFPITEDDEDAFDEIKDQMLWRNSGGKDVERIFQLFANHTLQIDWIFPDVTALLNEKKYTEVNDDIFFSLGFPRILTTGESQRTGTSDPEFASLSPVKSMLSMQRSLLPIAESIVKEISELNNLTNTPLVRFKPISLHNFRNFVEGLRNLYDTGNLSRTTYADAFGYNLEEELSMRSEEKDLMKELDLEEFAPKPFSPQPGTPNDGGNNKLPKKEESKPNPKNGNNGE